MDLQRSLLLNWAYFHQEKNMDELRQLLLLTMELEETRIKAQQDLKMRDDDIAQLKELLNRAITERDEAQEKCQNVLFEKLLLQQQLQQQQQQSTLQSGVSCVEDDPRRGGMDYNNRFSSSDCDESIVSSPHQLAEAEPDLPIVIDKPLPENGKFLQAVIKAGPLLQSLLVSGPLPQWHHPPPPLDTYQIPPPPVVIPSPRSIPTLSARTINQESLHNISNCGRMNLKRGLSEISHSSIDLKYQRILLQ